MALPIWQCKLGGQFWRLLVESMAVEGMKQQAKITQENRFCKNFSFWKSSRECCLEIRFGRQRIREDIRELDLSKSGERQRIKTGGE